MPTITHDIQIAAQYRLLDDDGNTLGRHTMAPIALDAITPLALLTLYETLHAKRNEARRQAGLRELPSPNAAVVLLATLRKLGSDYVEPDLSRIAEVVCEVVGEIARERGVGAEEPPLGRVLVMDPSDGAP